MHKESFYVVYQSKAILIILSLKENARKFVCSFFHDCSLSRRQINERRAFICRPARPLLAGNAVAYVNFERRALLEGSHARPVTTCTRL